MPSGFASYDDISYKNKNGESDPSGSLSPFTFLCISLALLLFGFLLLYSASYGKAIAEGYGHYHYFVRQVIAAIVAVISGYVVCRIPFHVILKGWYVLLPVSLLTAFASLIPGFSENGHIVIDDLVLVQPGLLCALTAVLLAADFIPDAEKPGVNGNISFLLSFLSVAVLMLTAALSSGLGYYVLTALITASVLKAKKLPAWAIALFAAVSLAGAFLLHHVVRFSDMYPLLTSEQYAVCLQAFHDGGTCGVGIGYGLYKLEALVFPESYQISAVLAEETGMMGFLFYLILCAVLTVLGVRTAGRAKRKSEVKLESFSMALTAFLVVPAVICPLYALSVLPLPGLLLPFTGYSVPGEYLTVLVTCILFKLVHAEGRGQDAN